MPLLGSGGVWKPPETILHCFPWCLACILFSTGDFYFLSIEKTATEMSTFIFRTPGKMAFFTSGTHCKGSEIPLQVRRAKNMVTVGTNREINVF